MDYYKKKDLKFNSVVRREIRHAETVGARESSRFERLSILRSITNEDLEEPSFEKREEKVSQEVKKPVSRLEILRKWKHEKLVKKELEKKQSVRPFYAGVSSLVSNKGTSKIGKFNQSSRDTSSISKVPSLNSNLVSRVPNTSKQVSSHIPNQLSRIPNSSKQVASFNSASASRNPNNSKQLGAIPKSTRPQLQRIPSSNQVLGKKTAVNLKTNQVPLKSKIQTGVSSPASSLSGSSFSKGFQNRTGVSSPASSLSGLGSTKGFQSRIANPVSVVPRRIPVQSKAPVTSIPKPPVASNKKLSSIPSAGIKPPAVSSFQKSNPGLVKKPGLVSKVELKKAPPVSGNKKAFPAPKANVRKEPLEDEKIPEEKEESGPEMHNLPDDIFDCDVSVIKRPSFAPDNFKFQPPTQLLDFSFDIAILDGIKEFTSRTSTPSKQNVKGTKIDDVSKVIQEPPKNAAIETETLTPPKQPAENPVKDKDVKDITQTPSEYLDVEVETNISTPSNQLSVIDKCDEDKETLLEPSEGVDIKENIITSNPGQDCKSNADDNEIMQRSSENVKIKSYSSSPSEELAQVSEKSPPKINLQNSCDSPQPICLNNATSDEEIKQKDSEKVAVETKHLNLTSNGENRKKKNIPLSAYQIAFQKRRSILKSSTLNSIAEADDDLSLTPARYYTEEKENVLCNTPRRSCRISNIISIDESPSVTPRRSQRISKLISIGESPSTTPRRSLRLQNKVPKDNQQDGLNHTNLTNDFDQLTLEDFDKMKPDDYLCDFDDSPEKIQSRKISLLYSPDKRKSIRRSIRGDLMSFSPTYTPPRL